MSPHNICFHGEIRKISAFFRRKKKTPYLLLCEMSNPICMDNKKQYRLFRENGGVPTKNYQFFYCFD